MSQNDHDQTTFPGTARLAGFGHSDLLDWIERTTYDLARGIDLYKRGDKYAASDMKRNAQILLSMTEELERRTD